MSNKTKMTKEQLKISSDVYKLRVAELEKELQTLQENCATYNSKITVLTKEAEAWASKYHALAIKEAKSRAYLIKALEIVQSMTGMALGL